MPNALRRCTLHQFSKGNNQLYLYILYKYKQLLIAHSIGLQRVRNRVCCWKWSSSPSASVQNRVQISVHSPVHESSPESRVQVLHQLLTSKTVVNMLVHAADHNAPNLKKACNIEFVVYNTAAVRKSEGWGKLRADQSHHDLWVELLENIAESH